MKPPFLPAGVPSEKPRPPRMVPHHCWSRLKKAEIRDGYVHRDDLCGYVHIYIYPYLIYVYPHLIYVYLTIYIYTHMCVYVCMDVWMYGFLDDGIVYKDQSMDVFQLE